MILKKEDAKEKKKKTLTVCDWRFWLVSITTVRGTVSSSSSLPGDGFCAKDMSKNW